jgi:Ca-activated chloride channel family protein
VPGTPEPATWGAALVMLSVLVLLARRQRRCRLNSQAGSDRFTA